VRTLIWSNTFLRSSKRLLKKRPDRRGEIERALRLLLDDPFNPKLETHKLKGKLSGTWACSVGYDLRIIFGRQVPPSPAYGWIGGVKGHNMK